MRTAPADTEDSDAAGNGMRGRRTGREYRLGEEVEVRLAEADPLTGGMIFHLMDSGTPRPGRARPRPPAAAPGIRVFTYSRPMDTS